MSRPDTWWTGVRRHGGHPGGLPQIQGPQVVGRRADGPATVGGRQAKGVGLAAQGIGQPQLASPEGHPAAGLDFADLIVGAVGQRRQPGQDPDRYIYPDLRKGNDRPLPDQVAAGIDDVARRRGWYQPAADACALPTESWRERVARRRRYAESWET